MTYLLIFLNGFLINLINCEFKAQDIQVVQHLRNHLNAKFLLFVDDDEDANLMMMVKEYSEGNIYYSVLNSTLFENILMNNVTQLSFIKGRTVVVTGEKLNLTGLLEQILVPQFITWMIFGDFESYGDVYIPVNCDVLFISSTLDEVTVEQVYYLKPGAGKTVIPLWRWLPETGKKSMPPFAVDYKKNNFQNVRMNMLVVYLKDTCWVFPNSTMMRKIECIQQDMLELMGERLNFSINTVECEEKEHPYYFPNGTESDIFRKLRLKEVDFSISSHVMTRRTFNRTDLIWPSFLLRSMMYIKPGLLTGRWASYLRPLESSVWWGIFTWILFTGVLIYVSEHLFGGNIKFGFSFLSDVIISILRALQVFCNQSVDIPPSYSVRMVYFFTFFMVLIFFQAYCGYLASSLTIFVPRFPFTDLNGFFENGEYQIMTLQKGFHKYYFKKVIGEDRREDFMLADEDLPLTVEEAIHKLCTQDFLAFPEFREDLLSNNRLKCKISELPFPILKLYMSMASPRHSPYREFINREMIYLRSTGILKKLGSRLSSRSEFLDKNSRDDYVTVAFSQIFSIFFLLGTGVLLSIFIFMCEITIQKKKKPSASSLKRRPRPFRRRGLETYKQFEFNLRQ